MSNNRLLFESIFKKNVSAPDAIDHLKGIVKEFPSFAPAHFFLLQLTNKEDATYQLQAAKTAVLFNNNYWLNYQLLEANRHTIEKTQQQDLIEQKTIAVVKDEPLIAPEEAIAGTIITDTNLEETTHPAPEEITIITQQETPQEEQAEKESSELPLEMAAVIEEQAEPITPEPAGMDTTIPAAKEETEKPIEINSNGKLVESNIITNTTQSSSAITEIPDADAEIETEPLRNIPINISKADTETQEDSFVFEPLHTTDYFASVGIKLSEETKATDKLGMQLKSFTDWLKTMKKIAATEPAIDKQQTEQTDYTIQKLAEKSNAAGETLTEAMADVLIQQGRIGKAIGVLEKLSLLNPSKSVFFAAKINQLKEQ